MPGICQITIFGHLDIWGDGRATVKREDSLLDESPAAFDL